MNQVDKQSQDQVGDSSERKLIEQICWNHRFGQMLIERYSDGAVAIDGKLVHDTIPGNSLSVSE
jgi:hypothetical protein